MKWDRRDDDELKLSVLTGFELAAGEGGEVALRLQFAKVQEQLSGHARPNSEQFVMKAATAETLAMELLAVVAKGRGGSVN